MGSFASYGTGDERRARAYRERLIRRRAAVQWMSGGGSAKAEAILARASELGATGMPTTEAFAQADREATATGQGVPWEEIAQAERLARGEVSDARD
jgi:hypothetical protein